MYSDNCDDSCVVDCKERKEIIIITVSYAKDPPPASAGDGSF
jgi:hypothetical protein